MKTKFWNEIAVQPRYIAVGTGNVAIETDRRVVDDICILYRRGIHDDLLPEKS